MFFSFHCLNRELGKSLITATPRELELRHRRDEILRETADLTSTVVQSLEQQHKFVQDTNENLHQQNALLALANEKMHSMNEDLTSVVDEINDINAQRGCLCCSIRKNKRRKKKKRFAQSTIDAKSLGVSSDVTKKPVGTDDNVSVVPELVENNEQEKIIVNELNQMRNQLLLFQGQVKMINRSFKEGDDIVQQLGNETNQYMHASERLCFPW